MKQDCCRYCWPSTPIRYATRLARCWLLWLNRLGRLAAHVASPSQGLKQLHRVRQSNHTGDKCARLRFQVHNHAWLLAHR
ncbi:Uncharacterised protein [Vibrio cholerae]|nr:Uncharacterised protein [Vibrio cholerae]